MNETVPPEILRDFQEVGGDLYRLGLVSSHGGNLSVRSGHDLWITGTGTMLGRLKDRHIACVFADGRHTGPPPSSDTIVHQTVYAMTGATAVAHAHPRHATALSFDGGPFVPLDYEGAYFLKEVPVIPMGPQQVEAIAMALQAHLVVILQGHGAYARGGNLWEALHWLTALEESAEIATIRRGLER